MPDEFLIDPNQLYQKAVPDWIPVFRKSENYEKKNIQVVSFNTYI